MRVRKALAVLAGAAALCAGIGLTAVSAWLITKASTQPPVSELLVAVVAVRAFGVSKGVLRYTERLISHEVAFRALAELRVRLYRHLTTLVPSRLATYRRGDLLSRLVDDVTTAQERFPRVTAPALSSFVTGFVAVFVAAAHLPSAGLVLLIGLAFSTLAVPKLAAVLTRWADRRLAAGRAELSAGVVEVVQAVEELTVLGALADQVNRVRQVVDRLAGQERRLAWIHGVASLARTIVMGMTLVGMLVVAIPSVRDGRLDGAALAVVVLLCLAAFEATGGLVMALRERERVSAALDRVDGVLRAQPAMTGLGGRDVPQGTGLSVRGLSARWPGADQDVISGVRFELPPGKRMAIVGPSGSGKSSLLAALLRFCPSAGEVQLGGVRLADVDEAHLRRTIGLAAADAYIFDSTLRQNLLLARPNATEAELHSAVSRAGLDDWVETLPRGLDTPVGEHGKHLSGGQRQRLALARALLADVPILLCDEPDTSLDPALADRLIADLLAAAEGRSVILVTHRLESLTDVDEVLVLENGRVTEPVA